MGSQWVEDPSWGNIFSGIAGQMEAAPGKALGNIAQAEAIKDARIKRQREQQMWDMGIRSGADFERALPPAVVPPTDYTAPGPLIGNPNNPADTAGLPTVDLQYTDPRAQAAAEARRQLAVSAGKQLLMKNPEQAIPQLGYGSVAAAGAPDTAKARAELQFYTTGKFPTAEEGKANNMAVVGPDGQPTGQVVYTHNGRTDVLGNPIQLKPGERLVGTGPVKPEAPNPLENAAVARKGLLDLEFKRKQQGGELTPPQAELAQRLFDVANPLSRVTEQEGGRLVEKQVRAEPIPASLMPLYDHVQRRMAPPQVVPPPPPVVADQTVQPPPIVPPVVAAQPPPIVDPNATRVTGRGAANPAELRKEINNTQQFSDWNTTVPVFNSAVKSATQTPSNQQDINIIYAFAKLMDPGSVVRESEVKLASSSGTALDTIGGLFQKLTTGGGTMLPEVRLAIIDTLKNRLEEYKTGKDMVERWYREKVAPSVGLDPNEVIPPTMAPIDYNRDELVRQLNQQRNTATSQPAVTGPRRAADDITGVR